MCEMEIDPSEETLDKFDVRGKVEEGKLVPYDKKNIAVMGRDEVISLLDSIDTRVELLRKEALQLQDERDLILTRIDLLKNTDLLSNLNATDHEEVGLQLSRINSRLQTVEVSVLTVRDTSQVDSLNTINTLIDEVIRFADPIIKRQKCQEYLNACSSEFLFSSGSTSTTTTAQLSFVDKKFESNLLGCTLDDQKRIKKRLEALLNYMAHQIILSD